MCQVLISMLGIPMVNKTSMVPSLALWELVLRARHLVHLLTSPKRMVGVIEKIQEASLLCCDKSFLLLPFSLVVNGKFRAERSWILLMTFLTYFPLPPKHVFILFYSYFYPWHQVSKNLRRVEGCSLDTVSFSVSTLSRKYCIHLQRAFQKSPWWRVQWQTYRERCSVFIG